MGLELLKAAEGIAVSSLDLLPPWDVEVDGDIFGYHLKIFNFSNASLDEGPQPMLQFSTNGTTFDTGYNYQTGMASFWANGGRADFFYIGSPHKGIFLHLDNAGPANPGFSGTFEILSRGAGYTFIHGGGGRFDGPMCADIKGWHTVNANIKGVRLVNSPDGQGATQPLTARMELWGYLPGGVVSPPGLAHSADFTLTYDSPNNTGQTWALIFPPGTFGGFNGSQFRAFFQASGLSTAVIKDPHFGQCTPAGVAASLTPLLFGGNALSPTIAANAIKEVDTTPFALDNTKHHMLRYFVQSGAIKSSQAYSGVAAYNAAGNIASQLDLSGMGSTTPGVYGVPKLEW